MAQIFKLLNKLKLQPSKVSTGKHSLTTLALLHGLKTIQKVLDVLNVILISLATTESASRRLQSPPWQRKQHQIICICKQIDIDI